MGYEAENEVRRKAFAAWCVDRKMMAVAAIVAVISLQLTAIFQEGNIGPTPQGK